MIRYDMQMEILEDIMNDLHSDYNLGMVREAVRTYLDIFENDELQAELFERKQHGRMNNG